MLVPRVGPRLSRELKFPRLLLTRPERSVDLVLPSPSAMFAKSRIVHSHIMSQYFTTYVCFHSFGALEFLSTWRTKCSATFVQSSSSRAEVALEHKAQIEQTPYLYNGGR